MDVEALSPRLWGRQEERAVLDELVVDVLDSRSRVLVLNGEAGIGKSALLDYVVRTADECLIARISGVESEIGLPFAGLHQLCAPFQDEIGRLPRPQRDALSTAFGLQDGGTPDQFMMGLAVLNLLAEVAGHQPVICVVDDAQWLDSPSLKAVEFMARRLHAEPLGVIFARRGAAGDELAGLPELEVRGLGRTDAQHLLGSVLPGPVDRRVRQRIIAESRGNPSALTELPRSWTLADLADGFRPPDLFPLSSRLESAFARRLASLPQQTRLLLLAASAEPLGDPALLWRAADRLDIDREAAAPAANAGLVDLEPQLRFRHPLLRSTSYRAASAEDRQRMHQVFAEVTDPAIDPDRRAWHLSLASVGTDEVVASLLEETADRARTRGGIGAAAAHLERSAGLTADPSRRARRGLDAARVAREAGQLDRALALLAMVEDGPYDARRTAEVAHLRGQVSFDQRQFGEACVQFLHSATQFRAFDAARSREVHLELLLAAIWSGSPELLDPLGEVAQAARSAPEAPNPVRIVDQLLYAIAGWMTDAYEAAEPAMTQALDRVLTMPLEDEGLGRWLWPGANRTGLLISREVWDYEAGITLAKRQVRMSRDAGAVVHLQAALNTLGITELLAGRLDEVAGLVAEERQIAEATGHPVLGDAAVLLAAYRGREQHAVTLIDAYRHKAGRQGTQNRLIQIAGIANAILHNGLGRYEVARDLSLRALRAGSIGFGSFVVGELAEAASRTGDTDLVEEAVEWLCRRTAVTTTDWALGIQARTCALLANDETTEGHYQASIGHLGKTPLRLELARSHLLYGEWLRGAGRRTDSREQLRTAHEMLTDIGAEAFAERARRELQATGETTRQRDAVTVGDLTIQELKIVQLAITGSTNPEIALQLFLSPRTVEWHMRKIFAKLGINSRKQLSDSLLYPSAT